MNPYLVLYLSIVLRTDDFCKYLPSEATAAPVIFFLDFFLTQRTYRSLSKLPLSASPSRFSSFSPCLSFARHNPCPSTEVSALQPCRCRPSCPLLPQPLPLPSAPVAFAKYCRSLHRSRSALRSDGISSWHSFTSAEDPQPMSRIITYSFTFATDPSSARLCRIGGVRGARGGIQTIRLEGVRIP